MASCAPAITTLSTCIITPSSPTPSQHMFLSAADIMWRWFHYNQRILFFKLEQPISSFLELLKSSLALALVDFFPFAGRVFEEPDGRLALDCNDAGVEFIEASIDLPFSTLEADGFQYRPFFKLLAPRGDVLQTDPDLPLLSVQVTRFLRDEGIVMGIAINHTVADGTSLWHFMKSWGECARGLPISVRPKHMREALAPEKLIVPPLPEGEDANLKPVTKGGEVIIRHGDEELVQRDFHFSAEMVKRLKHIVTSSAPEGHAPFSSLQALSAHVWRHLIAARGVDKSRNSALFLHANMRGRSVPPLTDAYFGNVLVRDAAFARAEELQEESIGRTAVRIQELIKVFDDKYMRTFMGKLEFLHPFKLFEGLDFSASMISVSSSPRFPVYEVDFGWGPASCVRAPIIRTDGETVWFAGREGGGSVDVSVALPKPVMERLVENEAFLSV